MQIKKLINLYYNIGKIISDNYKWGNKFVDNLALELKLSFPNLKGFSARNLNYMKAFYEEYKNDKKFLQLVAKLWWSHNIKLIQKIKNKEYIGIVLCQNKSNKIVDYILKYIHKPIGVSEYKIFDKLSKDILKELPTKDDINLHANTK